MQQQETKQNKIYTSLQKKQKRVKPTVAYSIDIGTIKENSNMSRVFNLNKLNNFIIILKRRRKCRTIILIINPIKKLSIHFKMSRNLQQLMLLQYIILMILNKFLKRNNNMIESKKSVKMLGKIILRSEIN